MEIASIKPRSLVEQVCDQLAELIRRHQPGSADSSLPAERRLAEQFGVSRQVVREAIKRLELQGLLEVRQGSGVRTLIGFRCGGESDELHPADLASVVCGAPINHVYPMTLEHSHVSGSRLRK